MIFPLDMPIGWDDFLASHGWCKSMSLDGWDLVQGFQWLLLQGLNWPSKTYFFAME